MASRVHVNRVLDPALQAIRAPCAFRPSDWFHIDLTLMVVLVISLALFFDFTNGFHDTANAMATPIATGAIKPKIAVALAAVLNLVGALLSTEVAKTISGGLIREGSGGIRITPEIIFAGLLGAIIWNLLTWLLGLPSSSSHALFGGLIGAAVVGMGFGAVDFTVLTAKVILPAVFAPLIAGGAAFLCTRLAYGITQRQDGSGDKLTQKRGGFRHGQVFSSSLVALAHGTNDAQKTMGIITLVLISSGFQQAGAGPAIWVIVSCASAIAAGTYAGGWRIIRTVGSGLTQVKPAQSTTQVASGSVIGSGLGRRGASVRWRTAGRVGLGWLFTLTASAAVGALAALIIRLGTAGVVIDAVLGGLTVGAIFLWSRRTRITHINVVSEVEIAAEVVKLPKKGKARASGGSK